MSGICGWIALDGAIPDSSAIERMAGTLGRFDHARPQTAHAPGAALADVTLGIAERIHNGKDALAVIHGRFTIRDDALARSARERGTATALAEAFRAGGPAILDALAGPFALAILLPQERRALLAIDRVGIRPLWYQLTDEALLFASSCAALRDHPQARIAIDPQGLYNYLYFHMVPSPGTVYAHVAKLAPGHYVHLHEGRMEVRPYWQVRYTREHERLGVGDLKQEFRELLRDAVRDSLDGRNTGAFLSGGTDSSTVSGLLGEVSGAPARTYSIGFDVAGYDELDYARIAARHFRTDLHEYTLTPADVANAIPAIARVYGEPFGNSSAIAAYHCAKRARGDGVEKLLAGDGGDELFGGNFRYAKQSRFALYGRVPALLRHAAIEPLLRSPLGGVGPLRKLRSYVQQANVPMPARLETYNLLERLGIREVLEPEFLSRVDTGEPLRLLYDEYWGAATDTELNRMLALDLKFTLADNDLPKVNGSAELAGMDIGYPLLNEALVAFAARLPVHLKLKGTRLRYFFKEALRDFLPPEIIVKKKHGFGLPFGPWAHTDPQLRELVTAGLASFKHRGIVRAAFIEDLLTRHLPEHPGYYGNMIWLLVMLEHWFQAHVDGRAVAAS